MKVINDDDEIFPLRNIELTNIFRSSRWLSEINLIEKSFLKMTTYIGGNFLS